jgi:energy-converting hydrogenase Eha subunit H
MLQKGRGYVVDHLEVSMDSEAKITPILIISCVLVATAGLMFGYDVGNSG